MKTALAMLAMILAGCASGTFPPPERTYFYEENSREAAWTLTAAWVQADSARRTWSTAGFTGSMRPAITGGEFLLLVRYDGAELLPGQIVVFERDGVHVLHRVMIGGGDSGAVFLKGDNNSRDDGWVSRARVRFICVGVVRWPNPESGRAERRP